MGTRSTISSRSLRADDLFGLLVISRILGHAEFHQDLGAGAVFAQIGLEAQAQIGVHGVIPWSWRGVGLDFVGQALPRPSWRM